MIRGCVWAFSKNYLVHDWHQAVTCVCKTRKRNAIHLKVSGPVISLKAANQFEGQWQRRRGAPNTPWAAPLTPLRDKKWHRGRVTTQAIYGSRVNSMDPCATILADLA